MSHSSRTIVALALMAATMTTRAQDAALLIELPPGVLAAAVGGGGFVVVGEQRTGGGFYWMPTTGVVQIGGLRATSISRDGRTIVGESTDARNIQQAAIWQRAAEWRLLGSIAPNAAPCDDLLSTALRTSADGKVIVGLGWNGCNTARATRWEEGTGVVDLGSTVSGRSSRADGVSGDGRLVVGWQEAATGFRQGARWMDGAQQLFTGPDGMVGEANAANHDGSIVVGQVCRPGGTVQERSAWIWTPRDGLQCLPPPRPSFNLTVVQALATSDNGRVIGGAHSFGLESEAVVWIDRTPHYLEDYLRDHGVPDAFEGWVNTGYVTGVSPDGRVLVGYGAGPRDFTGYVVILGSPGADQ